jgi:hypothetical protein
MSGPVRRIVIWWLRRETAEKRAAARRPAQLLDEAATRISGQGGRIENLVSAAEFDDVAANYRQVAGFLRKGI